MEAETSAPFDQKTAIKSILHAFVLLGLVAFAAPLVGFIPLSVLAAILLAAAQMGECHKIPQLLRLSRLEIVVWLTTCLLTIFAGLTVSVEVGMILAPLLMSIRKVTTTPGLAIVRNRQIEEGHTIQ